MRYDWLKPVSHMTCNIQSQSGIVMLWPQLFIFGISDIINLPSEFVEHSLPTLLDYLATCFHSHIGKTNLICRKPDPFSS